jgi:hypothetical protein
LIRALKQNQRLEVLSRPQVMTLDNQRAYVFVGQRVPTISTVTTTAFGQNNATEYINAGLGLDVTPRISPDNIVAMYITADKSEVGPLSEGIPVTAINGQVITQPRINVTTAITTVSAASGQTVALGGLITKSKTDFHRKVPWVGDIPVLGRLFRYDGTTNERRELLIIMTPHVVRTKDEADKIKQVEAARMNWCLSDVIELSGNTELRPRSGDWSDKETEVIYPDVNPRAEKLSPADAKPSAPEPIPTPPADVKQDKNAAPGKTNAMPQEPPRIPQPDTGVMLPPQRNKTANSSFSFNANGQNPSQTSGALPGVQAATYERPAGNPPQTGALNSNATYPSTANAVTPTVYDAPPRYPTTQQPYYR